MFRLNKLINKSNFNILKRCISNNLSHTNRNPNGLDLLSINVGDALKEMSIKKPNEIAYKFCLTNTSFSFIDLKQRVDELAQNLLNLGFKRGDRLAIMLPNIPETALTILAAATIGVTFVLMNPGYQLIEIEHMLKKTKAKGILIVDQLKTLKHYELMKSLCPEMEKNLKGELKSNRLPDLKHIIVTSLMPKFNEFKGAWSFKDIQKYDLVKRELPYVDIDDTLALLFTSGSTGFPKAASISHQGIINTAFYENLIPGCPESNKNVCIPIPMFHMFGLCVGVISSVVNGNTTTYPFILPDTLSTLKAIHNEKCTALKAAPVMYMDILNYPDLNNFDLTSLEAMLVGASTVPKDLLVKIKQKLNLKHVIIGYALTESSCAGSLTHINDVEKHAFESLGRPLPNMQIKIADPITGETLPLNTDGEICLRGYGVMQGYYDEPEKTLETIDKNGWLKTGDMGCMDEHKYVFFKSRIKELIIRGGTNIYPAEIERFLRTHENVLDCYVVGIPDERLGEEICAWIKLKPDTNVSSENILDFCKGQIAFYKIPKYIKFVDSFPISATGKCQKFKIQEKMRIELGLKV